MKKRVGGLKGRMRMLVLFVVFATLSPAGCSNPASPRPGPEPYALVVRIAGEDAAQARTALPPTPSPVAYNISVSRLGVSLGVLADADASGAEFSVPLSAAPAAGDLVLVEGFDNDPKKCAEGSLILPPDYTAGGSVVIALHFSTGGTGSVDLSVSLPVAGTDGEITAAELALYRSLEDYQGGAIYRLMRYRKDAAYGAGESLGTDIPIKFDDLPSGDYVVQIEFFRSMFVRVSRLVQTIIVREGLTTSSWSPALGWDNANKFASSNANLGGIDIAGANLTPAFSPTTYSYSITEGASSAGSPELTITKGTMGQTVAAKLITPDGTPTPVQSGDSLPLQLKGTNSLVITVTAPDGVTRQTYTVSYTYYGTEWYVDEAGNNGNLGTSAGPANALASVSAALTKITTAYASAWPGKAAGNPVPARINISGSITDQVNISDTSLYATFPPIILVGSGSDKINANSTGRPLAINKAAVVLGDGLALTGGKAANGGGVYVAGGGSFTMNGGSISGNKAEGGSDPYTNGGGGVYVDGGSSFIMNGGTIGGNAAQDANTTIRRGGGVFVNGSTSSFTMNGGTIRGNTADGNGDDGGGGVFVRSGGAVTMNGGTISGNTAKSGSGGGGVNVTNSGRFTMTGGTINENTATGNGGGALVKDTSSFTMTGGSISGNTATGNGGGVWDKGNFTMSGGTISGNTAGNSGNGSGGGVYVDGGADFAMSERAAVSGNTASKSGGGVYFAGVSFTMSGGSISGNTASTYGSAYILGSGGGGVFVNSGNFAMSGGSVSGNTAINGSGSGVLVESNSSFTMDEGTISGNATTHNGGGVYVAGSNSNFTMNGGTISGNTTTSDGGGVYVTGSSSFTIGGGTISGNTAKANGGGVYAAINFTMNGGGVSGNTAVANGGGVYFAGSVLGMNGGAVNGNRAAGNGGGVYVGSGAFAINAGGVTISGNTAGHYDGGGGGVFVAGGSFTMNGGTLTKNSADGPYGHGGAVYVDSGGTFTMNNDTCSVDENLSQYSGGGVHVASGGTFTMSGGSVSGNTTNHEGGGVDLYGDFTMNNGTITGNASTWSGGGVLVGDSGTFIMYNGTVSGNNSIQTDHDGVHKNDGGSFAKSGGTVDSITS